MPVKPLVIEDLNASCGQGATGPALVELNVLPSADTNAQLAQFGFINYQFLLSPFANVALGHAIVRIYVDPLATVTLEGSEPHCFATVTGHLETK